MKTHPTGHPNTAKQALSDLSLIEGGTVYRQTVTDKPEVVGVLSEAKVRIIAYLNQQVAIEEADAAAVPLSRR